jgi:uncharacterized integral membrane protein
MFDKKSRPDAGALFSTISSILAVPFVVMVLIFIYVALGNPEHVTVIYFDKFSEFWLELVVFTILGFVVIAGAFTNIRNLRRSRL